MPLECACWKCWSRFYPESAREVDRRRVWNALYVDPDHLRAMDREPEIAYAVRLAQAVLPPRGVLTIGAYEAIHERTLGPIVTESDKLNAVHGYLTLLDLVGPHIVRTTQHLNLAAIETLYRQHDFTGTVGFFVSYSKGTRLHFSDHREAVAVKLILDP